MTKNRSEVLQMIEIVRYTPEWQKEWDEFVPTTKNSTFLHMRQYMDYHSDRFADYSLVALKKGKTAGLLPACREGDTLYSHRGLTYGGWLTRAAHFSVIDMLEIWDCMAAMLKADGINKLIYKPVPHIYHSYPAEEDLYAIFRHNGRLIESNISSAIMQEGKISFNSTMKQMAKQAANNRISVAESDDFGAFWDILTDLLQSRYNAIPVHSLDEIKLLHSRFPGNIRLFTVMHSGHIIAGTVIFATKRVAHVQYIAASPEGKELKALPLLFNHLINETFSDVPYFDFGTSNEQHGQYLNEGLIIQKCGMGGRGIVYNTYSIDF